MFKKIFIGFLALLFVLVPLNSYSESGKSIVLKINSKTAYVNFQPVTLDIAPIEIKGRTLVPLRFISEHFGAKKITYFADTQEIALELDDAASLREEITNLKAENETLKNKIRDLENGKSPNPQIQPPTAPLDLQGYVSNKQVILSWRASSMGTYPIGGYKVFRSEQDLNNFVNIASLPASLFSFTDTQVYEGKGYLYYVKATDTAYPANESLESNRITIQIPSSQPPQQPDPGNGEKPDLTAPKFDWLPEVATENQSFTVKAFINNIGNALARSSHVKFYLSTNKQPRTEDIFFVSEEFVNSLPSGAETKIEKNIIFPDLKNTSDGQYKFWILCEVDSQNEIDESNETNNKWICCDEGITVIDNQKQPPNTGWQLQYTFPDKYNLYNLKNVYIKEDETNYYFQFTTYRSWKYSTDFGIVLWVDKDQNIYTGVKSKDGKPIGVDFGVMFHFYNEELQGFVSQWMDYKNDSEIVENLKPQDFNLESQSLTFSVSKKHFVTNHAFDYHMMISYDNDYLDTEFYPNTSDLTYPKPTSGLNLITRHLSSNDFDERCLYLDKIFRSMVMPVRKKKAPIPSYYSKYI